MNKTSTCLLFPACLLLCATMMPAAAESPVQALQPIQAVRIVVDCDTRALPSQHAIGEMLGQHNFSQVYASRARVMAEVGRACQRPDTERVGLVLVNDPPRARPADRRIARQDPPSR